MTENSTPEPETEAGVVRKGIRPAAVGLAILAAGALGLYGIARPPGKEAALTGSCAKSLTLARAIDPLIHGEVAALTVASRPNDLGAVAFDDAQGRKTSVAGFKGKTILLNLWATWCVPCRAEMPSLDRLEAAAGSKDFAVIPVDADTARLERARGFFKEIGAPHLPFYSDASGDILQVMKHTQGLEGLPTTILIGPDGCAIATMAGPAQWDSPEAQALIRRLVQDAETGRGKAA